MGRPREPDVSEDCVFCRIVAGDQPAQVVYRDAQVVAFLDVAPIAEGHTLIIPVDHHRDLHDTPAELAGRLMAVAKRVSEAVVRGLGADGSLMAMNTVVGQTVFHVHVHVIPRRRRDGVVPFRILNPIRRYRAGRREVVAQALRDALSS